MELDGGHGTGGQLGGHGDMGGDGEDGTPGENLIAMLANTEFDMGSMSD